ncbi:hypothetical protein EST38_g8927 [Candolleomyces aberdarensis]|uniref:Aminoglycoside phosphotransferase domain-containing protein n=1 Tax=Candolleomyces aberdarensis TaxID=2316362 RepID=A0A4Q2DBF2_9AGAR|nr:hypothetical protein EST38_g8927 [Candolleomyces aberdarensis]
MEPRIIHKQGGCKVVQIEQDVVAKHSYRVRPSEEVAMRLVSEHLPSVPIPQVYFYTYGVDQYSEPIGTLHMSYVEGDTLRSVWDSYDDRTKERIARDIWNIVAQLRTIPRPANLEGLFCCAADGSPSFDILLGNDTNDISPPLVDDEAVRARIFDRYVRFNGLSYRDGRNLPQILPRSNKSVFTHGDIAPQNILVDKSGRILALVDWENAGWYRTIGNTQTS